MQTDFNTASNSISKPSTKNESTRKLVLVTGDRGSGNTAGCIELFPLTRATHLNPVGTFSPPVLQTDIKTSINLMILSKSERNQSDVKWDLFKDSQLPGGSCMNWRFDPAVIARGYKSLLTLEHSKFLVTDEMGLLESLHAKGLNATFQILGEDIYYPDRVTIRPTLLGTALKRWPKANVLENPKAGEIRS